MFTMLPQKNVAPWLNRRATSYVDHCCRMGPGIKSGTAVVQVYSAATLVARLACGPRISLPGISPVDSPFSKVTAPLTMVAR